MTASAPVNILQQLMRKWDTVHPYNAAQAFKLAPSVGDVDWDQAWAAAMESTGLGAVVGSRYRYRFEPLNGRSADYPVRRHNGSFDDFVSTLLNQPFDDPNEPPLRPFVVDDGGVRSVGLVYQHWLADSVAIRLILRAWFDSAFGQTASPVAVPRRGYLAELHAAPGHSRAIGTVLSMIRQHIRFRRVCKIGSENLFDSTTRFFQVDTPPGFIDTVRRSARSGGVKVTDLFLAGLIEACAAHVPLQRRGRRQDVAVGTVVDLRSHSKSDLSNTFGLYLGFTNVAASRGDLSSFPAILRSVAGQTAIQRSAGIAKASLIWMGAAAWIGKLGKTRDVYHFYRKELPLAGGISNVDLSKSWIADRCPGTVTDFVRISPTGPMTPLAITTTTLGDRFSLGVTHRTGLIPPDLAERTVRHWVDRMMTPVR